MLMDYVQQVGKQDVKQSMFNILIAQGKVPPKSSGYIRSLAVKARQLSGDGEAAVVCTETETA